MTISAQLETRIVRSVAAVYAELTALERYPEWLVASGIVDVQRIVGEPIAPGARIRVQQQVAGRSATLDGVITVVEPDRLFGFEARDKDGVRVDIEAAVAPDGNATLLRWSIRVGLPLRYRMLEGMVAPQARRAAALDLEAFKRRLESVADGAGPDASGPPA
jgi:uncharacterized protein YndB with AHSA1/START domain